MSFPIQIITTDPKLLDDIKSAVQPLNTIQKEFVFEVGNANQQDQAAAFNRSEYTNLEVYEWLSKYRKHQGHCPYIIMVLSKPLSGTKKNLFGSHEAKEGLAWFTTEMFERNSGQFLFDRIRFCRYYFVRYMLSFVNPTISSHDSRNCMFDNKNYKPDLLLSYSTGQLCDDCRRQLEQSDLYTAVARIAISKLLEVVSNQIPRALVMKGGGVKGLALVGALKELEKYFTFNTFAGTSAGGIAASLLAAGYSPSELEDILKQKDFRDFKSNFPNVCWNLLTKFGKHSGKHFKEWVDQMIVNKLSHQVSNVKMRDLPHRAILYASWSRGGTLKFDSKGPRQETDVAFATRCSMSIPLFFVPETLEGKKVYDGGLGNNFPLRTFMADNNQSLFIGLYLKPEQAKNTLKSDLIDIVTDSDEREVVDMHLDKIVIIDPSPIKTTQFSLSNYEKELLLSVGKIGALEYLSKYHKDIELDLRLLQSEKRKVEQMRRNIIEENFVAIERHANLLGLKN